MSSGRILGEAAWQMPRPAKVETKNDDSTEDFIVGYRGGEFLPGYRFTFRKQLACKQYNRYSFRSQSGFMFRHVYSLYPLGIRQQVGSQKVRVGLILPQVY